jgi:transposase-like protein
MKTLDATAVRILLDPKLSPSERQAKLTRLARTASAYVRGQVECPACGDRSEKEHNNCRRDPTWLCASCGEQFTDDGVDITR